MADSRFGRLLAELGLDADDFEKELSRVERLVRVQTRSLTRHFQGTSGAIKALVSGLATREVFQAARDFEQIEGALRVATGSAQGAAREYGFVRQEAERLGLALRTAAKDYGSLSAAARGTALAGQETRNIFVGIAEASTALRLSADQTSGALTAIEQIISKGKVSAEELRGQLGERLPGAFQLAARSIGVTTAQLDEMLKKGELTAERLLPALSRELSRTFGPQAAEAARGTVAELNRFQTVLFELEVEFARAGFVEGLTEGLRGFREALADEEIRQGLRDLSSLIGAVGASAAGAIEFIVEYREEILKLGGALKGAQIGARFGPTGAVAGALLGAAAGDAIAQSLRSERERIEQEIASLESLRQALGPAIFDQEHGRRLDTARLQLSELEAAADAALLALLDLPRAMDDGADAAGNLGGEAGTTADELKAAAKEADALRKVVQRLAEESRKAAEERAKAAASIGEVFQGVADEIRQLQVDEVTFQFEQAERQVRDLAEAAGFSAEQTAALVSNLSELYADLGEAVAAAEQANLDDASQRERELALQQPFLNAAENIQREFANTFTEIFRNGVSSFEDIEDAAKDIFARLAGELVSLGVTRGAQGLLDSLLGGAGVSGVGGVGGIVPSLLGQLGDLLTGQPLQGPATQGGVGPQPTTGILGLLSNNLGSVASIAGVLGLGAYGISDASKGQHDLGLYASILGAGALGGPYGLAAAGIAIAGLAGTASITNATTGDRNQREKGQIQTVALFDPFIALILKNYLKEFGGGRTGVARLVTSANPTDPAFSIYNDQPLSAASPFGFVGLDAAAKQALPDNANLVGAVAEFDAAVASLLSQRQIAIATEALQSIEAVPIFAEQSFSNNDFGRLIANRANIILRGLLESSSLPISTDLDSIVNPATGQTIFSGNTSPEAVFAELQGFIGGLRELEDGIRQLGGESITQAEQSIRGLEDLFQRLAPLAGTFGVELSFLEETFQQGLDALRTDFESDIELALLGITDPLAAALAEQAKVAEQRLREAEELGASILLVEQLNAAERERIIRQFAEQANGAIRGLLEQLTGTTASPLAGETVLANALSSFREAVSAATTDLDAREDVARLAANLYDIARQQFASSSAFFDIYEEIQSSLEGLLGTPFSGTTAPLDDFDTSAIDQQAGGVSVDESGETAVRAALRDAADQQAERDRKRDALLARIADAVEGTEANTGDAAESARKRAFLLESLRTLTAA
ncbi:MAG: tape measure protein [Myxococcota bacterium]